eukprot:3505095-Rhodomonas_salina.2
MLGVDALVRIMHGSLRVVPCFAIRGTETGVGGPRRNPIQETALSVQFVPVMRFLVFDYGVYQDTHLFTPPKLGDRLIAIDGVALTGICLPCGATGCAKPDIHHVVLQAVRFAVLKPCMLLQAMRGTEMAYGATRYAMRGTKMPYGTTIHAIRRTVWRAMRGTKMPYVPDGATRVQGQRPSRRFPRRRWDSRCRQIKCNYPQSQYKLERYSAMQKRSGYAICLLSDYAVCGTEIPYGVTRCALRSRSATTGLAPLLSPTRFIRNVQYWHRFGNAGTIRYVIFGTEGRVSGNQGRWLITVERKPLEEDVYDVRPRN